MTYALTPGERRLYVLVLRTTRASVAAFVLVAVLVLWRRRWLS